MFGKAVFLLIGSVMIGATALMFGGKQSAFDSQAEQSEYQSIGIARDIATSGYNEILSAVKRQKMAAVGEKPQMPMLGGIYNQTVDANIYGDLDIRVESEFAGVDHIVASNVIFETPFPGAIALSDDEVDAEGHGAAYAVSGLDQRAPSRSTGRGFMRPIKGIITDSINAFDVSTQFLASRVLGDGNLDGAANAPSVTGGFNQDFYEAVYQEAITKPLTLIDETGAAGSGQSALQAAASNSSPDNPKIVRALGGLFVNYPVSGHGLLIVENGDFKVVGNNFDWEGLVLVRKQNVDTVRVEFQNNTKIHGGLVAYSAGNVAPPADCTGDFVIDGNELVTSDSVALKFTVLGAAISAGGSYDMPVTVRIKINGQNYTPFGSWGNAVTGNVNTGNSGTTYEWEPPGIYLPGSRIRIGGRSWIKRRSWYSGNSSSHWKTHMTVDNLTVNAQLAVLRDGDPVPNVGGYLGQYSVENFVSNFIDTVNDEMTLEESDGIFLYELGMTNPSSPAHDMQDLVMLVTMTKADPGCTGSPGITGMSRIEYDMYGQSTVKYSGEALAKLGKTLSTISSATRVVVTQDDSYSEHQEGGIGSSSQSGGGEEY